jgi:hypothetical protein
MGRRRGYGDLEALLAGDEGPRAQTAARRLRDEILTGKGTGSLAVLSAPAESSLLDALRRDALGSWAQDVASRADVQANTKMAVSELSVRSAHAEHILSDEGILHIFPGLVPPVEDRGPIVALCGRDISESDRWAWAKRGDWQAAARGERPEGAFDSELSLCLPCAAHSHSHEECAEEADYPPLSRDMREVVLARTRSILVERLVGMPQGEHVNWAQQSFYSYRRALASALADDISGRGERWLSDGVLGGDLLTELMAEAEAKGRSVEGLLSRDEMERWALYEVVAALPYPGETPISRTFSATSDSMAQAIRNKLKHGMIHPCLPVPDSMRPETSHFPSGSVTSFLRPGDDPGRPAEGVHLAEREHDGRWLITEDEADGRQRAFAFARHEGVDEGFFGIPAM